MIVVSLIVLLLAVFNPPQILWIMYFGGAIVASAWMPVALASVLSKRVTKAGAFTGMLAGFCGCFILKLCSNIFRFTLPAICDPVIIGIVLNVIGIVIGSALTQVTEEEKAAREQLFVVPPEEKEPAEVRKTLNYLRFAPILGVVIAVILIAVWALPYALTK